jgi:hypothetical protein
MTSGRSITALSHGRGCWYYVVCRDLSTVQKVSFNIDFSISLRIIILNTEERKCQSITTIYIYIMINFILLHVSTCNELSSGHLNLLL